jgi:hypothetical protein
MEIKLENLNPFPAIRWTATIYVRTNAGIITYVHQINELEELQNIVEKGPSWYAFDRIEIRLNDDCGDTIDELCTFPDRPMAGLQAARRRAKQLGAKLAHKYGLSR